jgi:hypothetical protein
MLDTSQNWHLFGYDLRGIGRHWLAAWRDFLWGDESPVRARLDEVVCLRDGDEVSYYHAGAAVAAAPADCTAVLLPPELVLARRIDLPSAADAELASVMSIEVSANSPFPVDDTGYGWRVTARDGERIEVQLALVSLSAAMTYLGQRYDIHDARSQEVWARVNDSPVMLHGFGEGRRLSRYRSRLLRVGGLLAAAATLVLLLLAVSAGARLQEARQLEDMYEALTDRARDASALRNALLDGNDRIRAVNGLAASAGAPRLELARLTGLLDDDAYTTEVSMTGRTLELRGRSRNAAALLEKLLAEPAYATVTAPTPFSARGLGYEEFHFRIELAAEAPR